MSVMWRMEVALTCVTIQLVATNVSVMMDISWTLINILAMVLLSSLFTSYDLCW